MKSMSEVQEIVSLAISWCISISAMQGDVDPITRAEEQEIVRICEARLANLGISKDMLIGTTGI